MGFTDVLLPWESVAAHVTDPTVSLLLIDASGSERTADAALHDLQRSNSAITIGGPEIVASSEDANAETQAWVNYVLLGMVIVFSAFAVLNTLMLSIRERSREFGLLQASGSGRRSPGAAHDAGRGFDAAGPGLGARFGRSCRHGLTVCKGRDGLVHPERPLLPALTLIATTVLLTGIGTMVPTRAILRRRPVDVLGVRE